MEFERRGRVADYKIYCDESCHLPHDGCDIMVFGALRCDGASVDDVNGKIKALRHKYNYHQEIKWIKLVSSQMAFYEELIKIFASYPALRFKATVVLNKQLLDHAKYNAGSAGTFYYKMAYYTLRNFLESGKGHRLYLDFMDTHGAAKARKLQEILETRDAGWVKAHIVRSHESQLVQLCDLLIGAIAYANRRDILKNSKLKNDLIASLEATFGHTLTTRSAVNEKKFNIFKFTPRPT